MNSNFIHKAKPWLFNAWPIIAVYLLYKPLYTVLYYGIGNPLAEWISTGSPLVLLGVCAMLFQQNLLSATQMILMITAVFVCGFVNSYSFVMSMVTLFQKSSSQINLWQILTMISHQNFFKIFILYFGPMVGSIGMLRLLWPKLKKTTFVARAKKKSVETSNAFGSAKFADQKEIALVDKPHGICVGNRATIKDNSEPEKMISHIKEKRHGKPIHLDPVHSLLIAPTGSGKGVGIVIPTLLNYPGSAVVTDFKGENYYVTHRRRKEMGKKVYVFDPFRRIETNDRICINVLDLLDPTSLSIISDSLIVAQQLCPIPQQEFGNTKFFQENAGALIHLIILYILCSKEVSKGEQNLFKVYELLCQDNESLMKFLQKVSESTYAHETPSRLAKKILTTDAKELSGVFSSAQTELRFLDDPYMRQATACSTASLQDVVKGRADLFLCMPAGYVTDNPRMARLITGVIFKMMENAGGNVPFHELLMLLDEMPAFRYLPFVDKCLDHGRAFGVRLLGVSVTIERLKNIYPGTYKTLLASDLTIFCGFSESETQAFLSKRLGSRTIQIESLNQGEGLQNQKFEVIGSTSAQSGLTLSETGRPLLTTDEISNLGSEVVIAILKGTNPIICHRASYYKDKAWSGLWEQNPIEARKLIEQNNHEMTGGKH